MFILHKLLEGGEGSSSPPRPLFTPGKDPVSILQEAGWSPGPVWTGAENLAPPGFDPRTFQPVASRYTDWATRPVRNTIHSLKYSNTNWTGHTLLQNWLLNHVIAGKTRGDGETRKKTWAATVVCWHCKEDVLNRTLWRSRFRRRYGPISRHNT
jgi:hypothetical protein